LKVRRSSKRSVKKLAKYAIGERYLTRVMDISSRHVRLNGLMLYMYKKCLAQEII
jgi:hypothetical protein